MKYNRDYKLRDKMLGIITSTYDIQHYSGLTLETLKELIKLGFADPYEAQNDCPSIGQLLKFMETHPKFTAHGYVVSPERDDYRVSIEGLECRGPINKKTMEDFIDEFRHADDFTCNSKGCHCWYD